MAVGDPSSLGGGSGFNPLSLIPAGIDAIAGLFGAGSTKKANDDAWAKHKWMLNYNTPLNQMKRLKAAGLNPALMYPGGGGAQVAGNSTPPPQAEPVNYGQGIAPGLDAFMTYLMTEQKIKLMEKTIESKAQDIATGKERERSLAYNTDFVAPQSIRESNQRIATGASTEGMNYVNMNKVNELLPGQKEAIDLGNEKMNAEIDLIIERSNTQALENSKREIELSALPTELKWKIYQMQENVVKTVIQQSLLTNQTKSVIVKTQLDKAFLDLRDSGLSPSDPIQWRIAHQVGERIKEYFNNFKN